VNYSVRLNRAARSELDRLDSRIRRQVLEKILTLGENPQDVKQLRGRDRSYRVRSGEYRILYEIDDAARVVLVFRVGHRREAYRNL
jgi:mRNA interferase RelE/StbE